MKKYVKVGRVGKSTVHDSGWEAFGYRLFIRTVSRKEFRLPGVIIFERAK